MKTVSNAYKESMSSPLRNRSYVKITFGNIDSSAASDGTWVSNGETNYSAVDTLDYTYAYGLSYATLECNRWLLDGSFDILPTSDPRKDGYISDKLSNNLGVFNTTPRLTRNFSQNHTFPGLTLTFDTRYQEWPSGVTVTFYLGSTVVDTETIRPLSSKVSIPAKVLECNKIEITFTSALPYHRARLEQVLYGIEKEYSNDDVVSTKQTHDVDPLSRRLPNEKFSFTILDYEHRYDPDNPEGIYQYIDINSPIDISFGYELPTGSVEWLKSDRYRLTARPSVQKNQATFSGTGLVGSLGGTFYKSKLGNKNLYDMAVEVLTDANLTPTEQGDPPWEIDVSLKDMYTTAALPIDKHMVCLQLIAHAARCRLFTDDDNIIHIKPFNSDTFPDPTDFTLDFDTITKDTQIASKTAQLKAVEVSKYAYVVSNDTSTLFEGTTTETQLHVEFSGLAQDVSISVSGGSLVSSNIYARAADLVLSSGTKTVTITGKTLSENSVVVSYPVSQDGEIDKEENPLITNDVMCNALAAHLKKYLSLRSTYDTDYRGNPELEVGDVIKLQTPFSAEMNALILVDEISFNGALSGKVKVKGLI